MKAQAALLKHEVIAKELEREIRAGRISPGDQLPGEKSLAERFAVSRNTVRAALSELGRAGLIATRTGKGSFVTFDGQPMDVRLGWARGLQQQGVSTTVQLLNLEQVSDPGLAAELGCSSERFLVIDRLRSIAGREPISRELSRIPATPPVLELITAKTGAGSLTALLRAAGLVGVSGRQWIEVRTLDETLAAMLDRPIGAAFLWSRCLTRGPRGALVEVVESYLDPAHFSLQFEFALAERR